MDRWGECTLLFDMHPASAANPCTVLILRVDRFYAAVLRQMVLQEFPRTDVAITHGIADAMLALKTCRIDLFITGVGAGAEGDVLDLLTSCAKSVHRPKSVLAVTAGCEYRVLAGLRALGVNGVFDATSELPDAFPLALRTVANGAHYWSQTLLNEMHVASSTSHALFRLLTSFEQVVLSTIGDGCDDADAAQLLAVRPSTICTVRRELHRKLGVQHRGQLVRMAAQHGFVHFTPAGVIRPGFALLRASYQPRRKPGARSGRAAKATTCSSKAVGAAA